MSTILKEYGGFIAAIVGGVAGIIILTSLISNWKGIGKTLAENITGTTLEYSDE